MKKTKEKILINAIQLFNEKGLSNVRLQDIAQKTGISAGNLSYHHKLKKDLVEQVLKYMHEMSIEMKKKNNEYLEESHYFALVKNYLIFQIHYRFFYRDILEIIQFVPTASLQYKKQMESVMKFTLKGMALAEEKGLIVSEPHKGHYEHFAKNIWAILNTWLIEREIFGPEIVSMEKIISAVWEFHYPYFTEEGKALYHDLKTKFTQSVVEAV